MADIKIIIDTTDLVDAKKKLASFQKQMGDSKSILGLTRGLKSVESNVKELVAAQKKGQLSSESFKQGLLEQKRALVQLGVSSQKASGSVKQLVNAIKDQAAAKGAADAARDLARAQKEVANAHEQTRQKYVVGAAAQARLKQGQRELSAAYRAGLVDINEYRQALILLNRQNLGNRRGTNNLGVAMQQTGYQVGDFVVQVQSGQNPMVAFGQQATQLVGVLYLLPPATLAATKTIFGLTLSVSALVMSLGIAIPILTAIGAYYMRMSKEADAAAEATDTLTEKLKSLDSTLENYANTLAALKAGVSLEELFSDKGIEKASESLAEVSERLKEVLARTGPMRYAKMYPGPKDLDTFNAATLEFKTAVEVVMAAYDRLNKLREKESAARLTNFSKEFSELKDNLALQTAISKFGSDSAKVKELELQQSIKSYNRQVDAQVVSKQITVAHGVALKKLNKEIETQILNQQAYNKELERAEEITKAISENNKEMGRNLAIAEAEVDVINEVMGAEDALGKLRATYARADYASKMIAAGLSGDELTIALDAYDALVEQLKVKEAANKAAKVAGGLEESRLASIKLFYQNEADLLKLQKDRAKSVEELKKKNEALAEAARIEKLELSQQISLLAIKKQFGENSAAAKRLERQHLSEIFKEEQNIFEAEKLRDGYSQTIVDGLLKQREVARSLALKLEDAAAAALRMANNLATSATYGSLAAGEFMGSTTGLDPFGGKGNYKYDTSSKFKPEDKDDTSAPSGGGSSLDPVERLRQQIELNSKLVGLSKEEATVLTQVNAIQNSLGKDRGKYSRETIVGLIKENEAYKEQQRVIEEAKAQQDALAETITNSMETAFMSIIDGTASAKDAFKSMASEIIKELLRIMVVEKAVKSIKGFFGFADGGVIQGGSQVQAYANGGAFSGGSQVQAYANGGVVNSPTNFPMSGNKMGLMGEAGPEAIMPLKRGSNGKLGVQMEGGGGGDVIHISQSFNFQANGDETVKKLIAQAAPKIAQMTKSSMLDDRRRGGVTKAAFG